MPFRDFGSVLPWYMHMHIHIQCYYYAQRGQVIVLNYLMSLF